MATTIIIFVVIIAFIIYLVNDKKEFETNKNNNDNANRKGIEINLKEYPNKYTFDVAGVHLNHYAIINHCKELDLVNLVPEPLNKYDSNAILVKSCNWELGYVPENDIDEVKQIIERNYIAYVEKVMAVGWIDVTITIRYS